MKKPKLKTLILLLICAASLNLPSASALITFGLGNDPVRDAGWPEGALKVANLKCRVGWWVGPPFGGGEWHFLYRGDTETFVQALTAFADMRSPVVELVIHNGLEIDSILKSMNKQGLDPRVDWTFTVWNPENWNRLYNDPKQVSLASNPNFRKPVAPPRMDVYVGGGLLDWNAVRVPSAIRVRDERVSAASVNPTDGALVR